MSAPRHPPCQPFDAILSIAERLGSCQFTSQKRFFGLGAGYHRSNRVGAGSDDFAELREYHPGDDERLIDWNAYGRTGRVYVRRYYANTQAPIWLLLDSGISMTHRVVWSNTPCTKLEYATRLAFLLANSLIRSGARVGVMSYAADNDAFVAIPPACTRTHLFALLEFFMRLSDASAGSKASVYTLTQSALRRLVVPSGLILISDFIAAPSEDGWCKNLEVLAQLHQAFCVRLVDPAERELPKRGMVKLSPVYDSSQVMIVDTDSPESHAAYKSEIETLDQRVKESFMRAGLSAVALQIDIPLPDVIFPLVHIIENKTPVNDRIYLPGLAVIA